MIKKFRLWLMRVWRWYRHRSLYVIVDPADNSVTLSRGLFDHMDVINKEEAKVFVFHLCNAVTENKDRSGALYAFTLNPDIKQPTQLCDIQYNSKYHSIGFETLCPTVNRILYDYALPNCKTKLSVEPATVTDNMNIYIILSPYDKPAV
mgnify:CR=1 FL=1|jgi:hypothetical protein